MEERKKEIRKIEYNYKLGKYEVFKPKEGSNGWYADGEKKTIHGLDELLNRKEFDFKIPSDIRRYIEQYRKVREQKQKMFSSKLI